MSGRLQGALEGSKVGRTNPTFRDALRAIEERWSEYRRALRQHHQPQFDQLFAYAADHADASGLLNHQRPLLPVLFSIDLEQERRLDGHGDRLEAQAARITDLEARIDDLEAAVETRQQAQSSGQKQETEE
jgi:hypothetical protein